MKAIETNYDGYRFRSRLEARWAVFFHVLGIAYRYEAEGYAFRGVAYLPDFYLPQYDCFVEIKGQQPTAEERLKAKLLALYSGKRVYTFAGDIWVPGESGSYKGVGDTPPRLTNDDFPVLDEDLGDPPLFEAMIQLPPSLVEALPDLQDVGLTLLICRDEYDAERDAGKDEIFMGLISQFARLDHARIGVNLSNHLMYLQNQQRLLEKYAPILIQEEPALRHRASRLEAYVLYQLQRYRVEESVVWVECTICGALELVVYKYEHIYEICQHRCTSHRYPLLAKVRERNTEQYTVCSARLLAAYTAARSARFERGEQQ